MLLGMLMQPVVHWAVILGRVDVDVTGELALEARENIVEGEGVSGKVDPTRVSSKEAEGVTWPETVLGTPGGDVGLLLFGVAVQSLHVVLPCHFLCVKVLLEDAAPFGASNLTLQSFDGLVSIHTIEVHVPCSLNVLSNFLISSVVGLINRATF